MALNLEHHLRFYGAYHRDPVNIGIHIVCVPMILLSALVLATNSPNLEIPAAFSIPYFPINIGTIAAFLYAILFILLEPVAGGLIAPLILGCTAYGAHLVERLGQPVNNWAIGIHVFSWIAQFIGHGKFEGRAPALLDNLVQALFFAPLFVWLEVLFAFGYRPELKARMEQGVKEEVAKFKNKGAQTNGDTKKES
ncbi:DUF962-domain-containing protein [Pseudovirgaria hyperparasitica]|uniref:DUF962-domain-containing protein n=1 Tax=Pseudovirgaria hyperparasitica TaxID=470096 RepID=A0A6A6W416_9PEZI|nr:DUF962-domain-containing protein [Pseudovirgaria hyperparasitica]KAF2756706.1 DUF962-domain-containing protein [Pseudovirgaria hyperparasitica]